MFNKKYSLSKYFGKKSKKYRRKHLKKNTCKHRRNKKGMKGVMKGG